MIRALLMIAGAGFVLAAGSFAAAVAIGGPDAVARGGWNLLSHTGGRWGSGEFHHHDHGRPARPRGTRAGAFDSANREHPSRGRADRASSWWCVRGGP